MRITGGEWRSRIIHVPGNATVTRPTMDQTRQAVFNILNSADWAARANGQPWVFNGTVLDGFAGSGAYAFEALSRGAAFATMVDTHRDAIAICQQNAEQFKCTAQIQITRSDMLRLPSNPHDPVSLCFLDPPYDFTDWADVLNHLRAQRWVDDKTILILEASSKAGREFNAATDGLITQHDQRRYGHALVTFGALTP